MLTFQKNLPSPTHAALIVLALCMLGILIFYSYEMVAVFIDTIVEKAGTANSEIMSAGMAGN
jgi:hypothetical protein